MRVQGNPIVLCTEGDEDNAAFEGLRTFAVPDICEGLQTVVNVIPLQLLAYHLATTKGLNVDCPRNLAKSVTVE